MVETPNLDPSRQRERVHIKSAWSAIGLIAIGAFVFKGLIPYRPFPLKVLSPGRLEEWFFEPTTQPPLIIVGMAACLLFTRHRAIWAALQRPEGGLLPALLLVPAALLYFWALHTGTQDLLLLSFSLFCLGGLGALGGRKGFQAIFLPAIFLLLLVPLPATLLNHVIYPLQQANAQAASLLLNGFGVPTVVTGTIVTSDWGRFQVIETCAGLRTMITLFMSAIVYADLFQRSRAETTLLILAAPLIGAFVNFARVVLLMANPLAEIAEVHTAQGLVMTVAGVLLIAGLDSLLAKRLPADRARLERWAGTSGTPITHGSFPVLRAVIPAGFLLVMALGPFFIQPWSAPRNLWVPPYKIPMTFAGWEAEALPFDRDTMGSVLPTHSMHRIYSRGEDQVEVFIASDRLEGRHTSLLSPKTVLPGPALGVALQNSRPVEGFDQPARASWLAGAPGETLSYQWLFGDLGLGTETLRSFLALDRSDWSSPRRLLLVQLSTRVEGGVGGRARAEKTLQRFAAALTPWLEKIRAPQERPRSIPTGEQ